jgi:hypothetical protein
MTVSGVDLLSGAAPVGCCTGCSDRHRIGRIPIILGHTPILRILRKPAWAPISASATLTASSLGYGRIDRIRRKSFERGCEAWRLDPSTALGRSPNFIHPRLPSLRRGVLVPRRQWTIDRACLTRRLRLSRLHCRAAYSRGCAAPGHVMRWSESRAHAVVQSWLRLEPLLHEQMKWKIVLIPIESDRDHDVIAALMGALT